MFFLISKHVRDAGLVFIAVTIPKGQDYFESESKTIGISFVKISDEGAYFIFRSHRSKKIREIAEHNKLCFGASLHLHKENDDLKKCGKLFKQGYAWYDTRVVFGYFHPHSPDKKSGGLEFIISFNDNRYSVMGPQTVPKPYTAII